MTYWAYLSYAHADELWAKRVLRRIEGFRVPEALQGQTVAGLKVGRQLRPLFRDRDELASAGNLRKSLEDALAHSSALIVLCSPAAAESKWVDEEIRTFISLRGTERVFPLILSGEPNSGDERECFPPSLRSEATHGIEPIAGDLRGHADGPRDGVLKVIAGLLEVGFDAIKRRDAQRRHRRAIAFGAAASLIAIVTSLTAVYAVQQRDLAEVRRAQAEELISFMLGDLRNRLREVGRLDLLDAVGQEAEHYFAALPPAQINDTALKQQSLALRQIGEVRLQQGQHAEAQSAFRSSLDQLENLSARRPRDTEVLFERSQAEFWLGASYYQALEFDRAEPLFRRYAESASQLVALEPGNPDYRMEAAYARSNLGSLAIDQGRLDAAEAAFIEAGEMFAELADEQPDNPDLLFEVAANDAWLAAVFERRFEWDRALDYRRESARIHARVTAATDHPFHKRLEAAAWIRQARAEMALGDLEAAMAAQQAALDLITGLVEQDSDNVEWQVLWLTARSRQGLLAHLSDPDLDHDPSEEIASFDQLFAIAQSDPGNAQWSGQTVAAGLDVAMQFMLDAQPERAASILARIDPLIEANLESAPDDLVTARHFYHWAIMDHLLGGGDAGPAHARIQSQAGQRQANLHLAALLARLAGYPAAAMKLEDEVRQSGYASAEYLALQRMAQG